MEPRWPPRGSSTIDVVQALARYVPVTLGHRYLGVPVAAQAGSFELTPGMLACYGTPIDGQPETGLNEADGVIPDEHQMYLWIKAAFQHFFNNVQKDPAVKAQGLRACRQLLAYLLREAGIQRARLLDGEIVESMIALLGLQDLARPAAGAGDSSFPFERRFGRLQLDDQNLYATTFSLSFADSGTTRLFWGSAAAGDVEVM